MEQPSQPDGKPDLHELHALHTEYLKGMESDTGRKMQPFEQYEEFCTWWEGIPEETSREFERNYKTGYVQAVAESKRRAFMAFMG